MNEISVKHNIIILKHLIKAFIFTAVLFPAVSAFPDTDKDILKEASGISESDYREAAASAKVSLFYAYTRAVIDTERLRIGREAFLQAKARKDQAFAAFLPYISLQGAYILPTTIKGTSIPSSSGSSTGISVYARQNILSGLNDLQAYQSAGYSEKFRRMELQNDAGRLLLDLANLFYNTLTLERGLQNSSEILKLYTRMRNELKRRVALGRSKSSDLLRIDTQIFQLEAQIKELKNRYDSLKRMFATMTGIPGDFTLDDSHSLGEIPDVEAGVDKFIAARWDVKIAGEELELGRIRLRTAYGGHLPTAYIQGAYTLMHRDPGPVNDYYAGLGVELPVFSGGEVNAKIREAESQLKQSELKLADIKRSARQEIIDAAKNYESSSDELEAYYKAYISAQNNYKAVSEDYNRDRVTILDLLTSLTTLQDAKNDYEKAKLKKRLNRIWLGVATSEFTGENIHLLNKSAVKE